MTDHMRGIVNYANEPRAVALRELPVPAIGNGDVLLRVEAVGVCGSDVHQYLASQSWGVDYPVVLGHEFTGVVARAGRDVRKFAEGDRVVSETAAVVDAYSPFTRAGRYNLDPGRLGFGTRANGAMADFVAVPERCLHTVPAGLPFEKAALTEPACVAYSAVCVNARIRPGDSVMVIGPGPIGLLCATFARLSGASTLIVAGLPSDEMRLAVAREMSGCETIGADAAEIADHVKDVRDGYGMDVVIDAAGVSRSLQLALEVVRPAGTIVKVGWGPQPLGFSLDPLVAKNVTLQGSFSHTWSVWETVVGLLADHTLELSPIISRVAALEDWQDCFEGMHSGELIKAVLTPGVG